MIVSITCPSVYTLSKVMCHESLFCLFVLCVCLFAAEPVLIVPVVAHVCICALLTVTALANHISARCD